MKSFLLSSVALIALTSVGHASVVFNENIGQGLTLTLNNVLPTNTSAPFTFNQSNTLIGARGDQYENGSLVAKSPFSDPNTEFDAVLAGGSATFPSFALEELAVRRLVSFSTFGAGSGTFSFIWGTPDSYNGLSFDTNSGTKSFDGSVLGSFANGGGSYFATVSGLGQYYSTTFTTGQQNAFEFAAVSAVPLPASAPMFGAALLAVGLVGYGVKRKKTNAAAA